MAVPWIKGTVSARLTLAHGVFFHLHARRGSVTDALAGHRSRSHRPRQPRIPRTAETGEASHRVIQHGLTDGIEEITGRRAIGLVSTNNIDPDRGVEVFIVDPTDTDGHVGDGASGG